MDRRPEDVLRRLVERDPRYHVDAYRYIFEALDFTLKNSGRKTGHVSGRELLDGIRLHAIDQFGAMAPTVFGHWGVRSTDDFGEIVFSLVEVGLMGKTEQDSKEDFRGVYAFSEAFAVHNAERSSRTKRTT
ncbi:MAG: hypothetical protein HYY16_11970 [Planctomycetes bacterium]|nr:hypothetical protein [Planctomycetota bacterium]